MRRTKILTVQLLLSGLITLSIMAVAAVVVIAKLEPIEPVSSATEHAVATANVFETEQSSIVQQIDSTPGYGVDEVEAVAKVLSGECYDDELDDKRNVAWVICNRVSDGRFGDGILGVITEPNQFTGYWVHDRTIRETDWLIAAEVLEAYFAGEEPAHDYLYFTGGTGKTNNFSDTW